MDLSRVPRAQLEGLYLVGQWVTMRLSLHITILNYVELNQRIYIQAIDLRNEKDRRAWYILPDGSSQPI